MVWQPLYGHCWDNLVGDGHTSSRRGIVSTVGLGCDTRYGECIRVGVGYIDGKERVDAPDLRKTKKEERESVRDEYSKKVDAETKIAVDISLAEDKHFDYRVDGVRIDRKVLQLLKDDKSMDFLAVVDRLLEATKVDKQ